nr:MAG TPA: tail assembly protein [Caudoviricetes sp.]
MISLSKFLNLYRTFLSYSGTSGVSKAEISLLVEGGSNSVTFPVIPANLPTIENTQNNDTFNSVIGDISIIGLLGLRKITFDDFLLPNDVSKYSFAKGDNASTILNFIQDHNQSGQPFRLIMTKGDDTICNMSVLIDTFSYYQDPLGDTHLSIDFTEYRTYNEQTRSLEA